MPASAFVPLVTGLAVFVLAYLSHRLGAGPDQAGSRIMSGFLRPGFAMPATERSADIADRAR